MNIDKRTTISLSEAEVKLILAEHLRDKGYKVWSTDIELRVTSRWKGDHPYEYEVKCFDQAVVVIKED